MELKVMKESFMENILIRQLDNNSSEMIKELKVNEFQSAFIETSADCLDDFKNNAYSIRWSISGVYFDTQLIGFAMHGQWKFRFLPYRQVWLDRFMIDAKYQGKGYGKRALQLLIPQMYDKYHCKKIYLSSKEANVYAIKLYEDLGFKKTIFKDPQGERIMTRKKKTDARTGMVD